MLARSKGFLARILVDVDLQYNLPLQFMMERKGFVLVVDLEYERVPDFRHC